MVICGAQRALQNYEKRIEQNKSTSSVPEEGQSVDQESAVSDIVLFVVVVVVHISSSSAPQFLSPLLEVVLGKPVTQRYYQKCV